MATDIFGVLFQGRRRHYFEEWLQKRIRGSVTKSVSSFWI